MSLDRARFDRRTMLAAALATGGGAILAAASRGEGAGAAMAQFAARTKPAGSDLGAIEHVVFLMQENRSFDHYYGTYPGVRGFDDHPARHARRRSPRPGRAGATRNAAPLPSRHRLGHRRVHPGPRPHLAGAAHELGRRHQRRLRQHARAVPVPGARARRPHHGLLPPAGPALLLRAGRRVHPLRQLPLLGPRADRPQPPHGALGHRRPHGPRRRAGADHQRVVRRHRQRALGHHARGAGGRRGELEGLQPGGHHLRRAVHPAARPAQRRHPPLLQPVPEPLVDAVPEGLPPAVPQRLPGRHQVGPAARGQLDDPAHRLRRAPVVAARPRRVVHQPGARRPGVQPQGVVQDGALPHVRRERRVLRPRAAAGGAARHARGVRHGLAAARARRTARPGRSAWASASRCSSSRPSAAAGTWRPRCSTTRRSCAS